MLSINAPKPTRGLDALSRFDPWRRLLLPMVFGLLEGGVYLGCVSSSGIEDGGFVCLFFSWASGSLRCVVPGGARMRETASRSWNKVLRASLFFTVVSSGGGIGSVSLCIGVLSSVLEVLLLLFVLAWICVSKLRGTWWREAEPDRQPNGCVHVPSITCVTEPPN